MLEFDDGARSEAPPEEVWKILYDPVRFTEWWEGFETTSVGDGEFTLQQVGVPELQLLNRLDVREDEQAVVIRACSTTWSSAGGSSRSTRGGRRGSRSTSRSPTRRWSASGGASGR